MTTSSGTLILTLLHRSNSKYAYASKLLAQLRELQLPATWALGNATETPLAKRIDSLAGQEVAVASSSGISDIVRQVQAARQASISISSVVMVSSPTASEAKSLAALGIAGATPIGESSRLQPKQISAGLYEMPLRLFYPTAAGPSAAIARLAARGAIDKTVQRGDVCQIAVVLSEENPQGITALLKLVRRRSEQKRLTATTLSHYTARLSQRRQRTPSQSVLKAA